MPINRSQLLILVVGAFSLGIFIGRGSWLFGTHQGATEVIRTEAYQFIRQSAPSDPQTEGRKVRELQPFRYKVEALIEEHIADEDVQTVSIYFRDLENGNWFGIGEGDLFSPESRLKLPVMLAYYKWAETNPQVLRKKLTARAAPPADRPLHVKPPRPLEHGKTYSINDLIFRMIAHNDNDAYALLAENLPPKYLEKIYKDLYVNYSPDKREDSLSLSAYASFFRVLFNASYLSEDMSEKALRYLSRASFRSGMASGVPPNVITALKAGERELPGTPASQDGEIIQLHEFGIIYHARRPFLLGITARGTDFDGPSRTIRNVTRLIYAEVDRQSD